MKSNVLGILTIIGLAIVSVPAALLFFIGIIPTLAAKMSDTKASNGSVPKTVAFFNLAGVLPFMLELISLGQNMDAGMAIIKDSLTWLTIYGIASLGWLVVFSVPKVAKFIQGNVLKRRIYVVTKQQELLREEWGTAVTKIE